MKLRSSLEVQIGMGTCLTFVASEDEGCCMPAVENCIDLKVCLLAYRGTANYCSSAFVVVVVVEIDTDEKLGSFALLIEIVGIVVSLDCSSAFGN